MKEIQEYNHHLQLLRSLLLGQARPGEREGSLSSFDWLATNGSITDIGALLDFLYVNDALLRQKSADTIICLFKRVRRRDALAEGLKLLRFSPHNLDAFQSLPPESYVELLAIASFNMNGYVRQKAVELLTASRQPASLRYLLFRSADWVVQVREAAVEGVRSFLRAEHRDAFIRLLGDVDWLLAVERTDLSGLFGDIIDLITSDPLSAAFIRELHLPEKSRLLLFRLYLKKDGLSPTLLPLVLADKSFLIRDECFKYLSFLSVREQRGVVVRLLRDRSAKIRLHALYALKPFRDELKAELLACLSDPAGSMREWARLYLKDQGFDLAAFYRAKIATGSESPGDIMGLSETGGKDDLPILEKYIYSESAALRLSCLVAINRLDEWLAIQYALSLLTGRSNRISAKCIEILAKNSTDEVLTTLRELYAVGSLRDKKFILMLYNRIGGWKVIADLLLALLDPSGELTDLAWSYLEKWRMKAVHRFVSPSSLDLSRAHEAYEWVNKASKPMPYRRQNLWDELPFFMRP